MSLIYTLWIILVALIEISIHTHASGQFIVYIHFLALHKPQHLMYVSFVWYYICDYSLYVCHVLQVLD